MGKLPSRSSRRNGWVRMASQTGRAEASKRSERAARVPTVMVGRTSLAEPRGEDQAECQYATKREEDVVFAELRLAVIRALAQRAEAARFHRERYALAFAHRRCEQWNRVANGLADPVERPTAAHATAHLVCGANRFEFHLQ